MAITLEDLKAFTDFVLQRGAMFWSSSLPLDISQRQPVPVPPDARTKWYWFCASVQIG